MAERFGDAEGSIIVYVFLGGHFVGLSEGFDFLVYYNDIFLQHSFPSRPI